MLLWTAFYDTMLLRWGVLDGMGWDRQTIPWPECVIWVENWLVAFPFRFFLLDWS